MNALLDQYTPMRTIVVIITTLAALYVCSTNTALLQPLILFSALMISCINIVECIQTKSKSKLTLMLQILAACIAFIWLVASIHFLGSYSHLVDYGSKIH